MKSKRVKKSVKQSFMKRWVRGSINVGMIYIVAAMFMLAAFGLLATGGPSIMIPKTPVPSAYACCDSGNGSACHPLVDKQITFNGEAYGLLKSNIYIKEAQHLQPATPNQYAFPSTSAGRIFVNTTSSNPESSHIAKSVGMLNCKEGQDLIGIGPGSVVCNGIPDDQLIYVCKATQAECAVDQNKDKNSFDVYFRMRDFNGTVASQIASECPVPDMNSQRVMLSAASESKKRLQLETFKVEASNYWLSPWCKPAINLYPEQPTQVHVEVYPKAPLNYTIPLYPKGGWEVTAYPDGKIVDHGEVYPYLYWEAAMPDSLIIEPTTGYVVQSKDLPALFATVLPQMGLNKKESDEFSEYWLQALPVSPYYFVGVVPIDQINYLAPLKINPTPESVLRVSLYFKALDKKIAVKAPQFSKFERVGFTVTEWGGFFKADKNHPGFTCLM